tara:strand:+ start:160 stop:465 length:306 start_codon:yes stop_codon:yes gene_type:complete
MKKLLSILIVSLLWSLNAHSYSGLGVFECGELLSRKDDVIVKNQVENWAQGYVTGRNYEQNSSAGKNISGDSLFWAVVKYCEDNPLKDAVYAMESVYNKLK